MAARFTGSLRGARGAVTRKAGAKSGMVATIRGRDYEVTLWAHDIDGDDLFDIEVKYIEDGFTVDRLQVPR